MFNYFGESQNIEIDDKCMLDEWNTIQGNNVFVAPILYNYKSTLQRMHKLIINWYNN
jgi:hypothetical protein